MRKIKLMLILVGSLFSCSAPDEEITLGKYRITYKANVETGRWFGNYTNSNGEQVCVCEEPLAQDGWFHSFATNEIPAELTFEVTSEFYSDSTAIDKPDVTASIYLNGELLKTQTNALGDGKTIVSVINGKADVAAPAGGEAFSFSP